MKRLTIVSLIVILSASCATKRISTHEGQWADLEEWDADGNYTLDEEEFITGYVKSEFFARWSRKGKPDSIRAVFRKMFTCLDTNGNNQIDSAEFIIRTRKYLLKDPKLIFNKWNIDAGDAITYDEFTRDIAQTCLSADFDASGDRVVTPAELAAAMFQIADQDQDNKLGGMEFYLWQIHRCSPIVD